MIQQIFAVFDSAAKLFLPTFHAATIESAIRSFRHAVNRGDSDISKFPEDYTLFHVGSFDQESGQLVPLATPHSLGVAVTFLEDGRSEVVVKRDLPKIHPGG